MDPKKPFTPIRASASESAVPQEMSPGSGTPRGEKTKDATCSPWQCVESKAALDPEPLPVVPIKTQDILFKIFWF